MSIFDPDLCRDLTHPTPHEKEIKRLKARQEVLTEALRKYEEAFSELFGHCCSNGVFNAWGKSMDCNTLNEAHRLAENALNDK